MEKIDADGHMEKKENPLELQTSSSSEQEQYEWGTLAIGAILDKDNVLMLADTKVTSDNEVVFESVEEAIAGGRNIPGEKRRPKLHSALYCALATAGNGLLARVLPLKLRDRLRAKLEKKRKGLRASQVAIELQEDMLELIKEMVKEKPERKHKIVSNIIIGMFDKATGDARLKLVTKDFICNPPEGKPYICTGAFEHVARAYLDKYFKDCDSVEAGFKVLKAAFNEAKMAAEFLLPKDSVVTIGGPLKGCIVRRRNEDDLSMLLQENGWVEHQDQYIIHVDLGESCFE